MRYKSVEGWNFDRLGNLVGEWNKIAKTDLSVSDYYIKNGLVLQFIKKDGPERIVGMLFTKDKMIVQLGTWDVTVSVGLYKYAVANRFVIAPVQMMSDKTIDILQAGMPGEYTPLQA